MLCHLDNVPLPIVCGKKRELKDIGTLVALDILL
jgi:hypothetical protein